MPFGIKNCLNCSKRLILKIKRDIIRKKYCGYACRQKYRYKNGEFTWFKKMQQAAHTPESNKKKSRSGKLNSRFLIDRTKVKRRPRYEMDIWRKAIFHRDNYTCQNCRQIGGQLQADHIKPYCLFPNLRWELSNGRTLCIDCHKKTDTYGAKARKYRAVC